MKLIKFVDKFEKRFLDNKIPELNIGNKVRVGIMIKEGEKKRVQFFEGIVISKNKSSIDTTFTIRRIFQGVGIERTFPINSPQIKSIKIIDKTRAKRAKLFYLRNKVGKAAIKIQGR